VSLGKEEERTLNSGLYTVADVYCNGCLAMLGWKYIYAYDEHQKPKEGTYIVEVFSFLLDYCMK
jgi:hypothetical protein